MKIKHANKIQRAKPAYQQGGVADSKSDSLAPSDDLRSSKSKQQEAHTAPTKYGMGDHYGSGSKNPIGRMRSDSVGYRPITKKKMGIPPKSVV